MHTQEPRIRFMRLERWDPQLWELLVFHGGRNRVVLNVVIQVHLGERIGSGVGGWVWPNQIRGCSLILVKDGGGLEGTVWSGDRKTILLTVKVKVTQSCLTFRDPMDTVHAILQARILECVAYPFSRGSSQPRNPTRVSCVAEDSLATELMSMNMQSWALLS